MQELRMEELENINGGSWNTVSTICGDIYGTIGDMQTGAKIGGAVAGEMWSECSNQLV